MAETITITRTEYDRLVGIAKAAQRAVMSATVRDTGEKWAQAHLADMNNLAVLVPATRDFAENPLT